MDKKRTGLFLIPLALFTILLTYNYAQAQNVLTQEDNKAKQTIITNMSAAVDHKWSQYDLIIGSKKFDNGTFVIYNSSASTPEPPPICKEGEHLHEGVCVPNPPKPVENETTTPPVENETQPPVENQTQPPVEPEQKSTTKINLAGDYSGTSIINAMDKKAADWNVGLGDLGYKSTLTEFQNNFQKLPGDLCVIGNHDSNEDGNSEIYAQAQKYCGQMWFKEVANGTTLLIGWNSNGNSDAQLGAAQEYVMNEANMKGIENVIIMSHKPYQTHPNSHHNPESSVKTFYSSLHAKIPEGIKIIDIVGHNHEIAGNKDGTSYLAGGGGQSSHRNCGTDSTWTFCKATSGFLQLEIDNDSGDIKAKFYNSNGGVIS